MTDVSKINQLIQQELHDQNLDEVSAVEAAGWLHFANVLEDSATRPGQPLRRLLREGLIDGQIQRPQRANGRWFVQKIVGYESE